MALTQRARAEHAGRRLRDWDYFPSKRLISTPRSPRLEHLPEFIFLLFIWSVSGSLLNTKSAWVVWHSSQFVHLLVFITEARVGGSGCPWQPYLGHFSPRLAFHLIPWTPGCVGWQGSPWKPVQLLENGSRITIFLKHSNMLATGTGPLAGTFTCNSPPQYIIAAG